ncbi:mycofactocin system transcriptional regulator [Aeromicrobium yanjiei]|uniref:Mycofactocin system transcriptional regulator n=1 Tax=Aeromicrobium yanjiei TaxID=2662028 RepID=A0A5Q2MFB3_9ACTN|nr:mycofactocin system transcriptional regulator [Aeromicrobium yanjiei]QGG40399.1 mycofactocin system transcriptional regulator [Aeromicrobium yanjiei]
MNAPPSRSLGRPSVTDHATIEHAAFQLFERQGFEETTLEQIADAVGVGRRTLFRYFPSKNDIPWGQFDESLRGFRQQFDQIPADMPLADAVHRCVVDFNRFDDVALDQHRFRMRLLLTTPALQAHSALKYEAWRGVIAEFIATRLGLAPDDAVPRLVGHVSLAQSVAAYEQWLGDPDRSLTQILEANLAALRDYLC